MRDKQRNGFLKPIAFHWRPSGFSQHFELWGMARSGWEWRFCRSMRKEGQDSVIHTEDVTLSSLSHRISTKELKHFMGRLPWLSWKGMNTDLGAFCTPKAQLRIPELLLRRPATCFLSCAFLFCPDPPLQISVAVRSWSRITVCHCDSLNQLVRDHWLNHKWALVWTHRKKSRSKPFTLS